MVYSTCEKSYNELFILYQKYLHSLATKVYQPFNNLNLQFMWNCFNFSALCYEPRKGNKVNLLEKRTSRYGVNSLLFREAFLWNNLASKVKESNSVAFKEKIKKLGNLTYLCAVCR